LAYLAAHRQVGGRGHSAIVGCRRARLSGAAGDSRPRLDRRRRQGPNLKQIQRVHDAWKAMVERAPHARYTNVPSSGHQMPAEVPGVVVDAIGGILETLAARR